jgi:beta-glucanase (GH16 family)
MKTALLFTLLSFSVAACAQTNLSDAWIAFDRAGAQNSNLQCFMPENVSVSGGNLVLVARQQKSVCNSIDLPTATFNYTSGFISMRRFNFLYGTVEVRAKFGGGKNSGSWPIVWMEDVSCQLSDPTGTGDGCNSQEIDIAEILFGDFNSVNEQIHVDTERHRDQCTAHVDDVSKSFHIYDLVWSPGSLLFKIDGQTTCAIVKSYVPNSPMYLKIDDFVGGYGGQVDKISLPWTTLVDYVKVTQGSNRVFFDDFDGNPAFESTPAVSLSVYASQQPESTFAVSALERWLIWIFVASALTLTVIAMNLRDRRRNAENRSGRIP